jgi:hypothetical protein
MRLIISELILGSAGGARGTAGALHRYGMPEGE